MATPSWESLWPYRAVLAVDAANFSANTSKAMQQVNFDIQQLLAQSLSVVGLAGRWEQRQFPQHTGDGYVAGLDPEVLPGLVGCFPDALRQALTAWARENPRMPPLRLRVSIHVGPLPGSGLGVPMVETHRLLEDRTLKELLSRSNPDVTNTVVIISQRVYEDVFDSGLDTGGLPSSQFAPRLVKVKTFEKPAWLHVPGLDWGLADPSLFEVADQAAPDTVHQVPMTSAEVASPPASTSVTFSQGDHGMQGINQNNYNTFGGR